MKIAKIEYSIGTASIDIFISGCNGNPHCEECYNPELWSFDIGEEYSQKTIDKILWYINDFDSLIDNILIMGGEPLDQETESLRHLLKNLKNKTSKDIYLFTHYDLKDILSNILFYTDYVKCGRYIPELKCDNNISCGIKLASSNQRIYKKGLDY